MKLLFCTEARFGQTARGKFHSADQSFSYQMFKRYLTVFADVSVIARCTGIKDDAVDENTRVDGVGVKVVPMPYYIGPYQYLIKRNELIRKLENCIDTNPDAAIICRVPGMIGMAAAKYLIRKKRSYGVEVVGDPGDVFAPGSFHHPFRAVFRQHGVSNLKFVVKGASASIYVTKKILQTRYPHANKTFSTYASNVMLPPDAFVEQAKRLFHDPPYSVVSVGSLAAMYKSPDIAVAALLILKQKGLPVTLRWVGDGRYRSEMMALAEKNGISDRVTFVGNVASAAEVRHYLDAADLFVLPSRTEGLPRALVEAMARGLPCVGTDIGGIRELLERKALVPVNNAEILAEKIHSFLNSSELSNDQAKRNLKEAHSYAFEYLEGKRREFYNYLRDIS
jgi:glycosyltransferase involved in cell wall biosynthesis